MKVIMNAFIRSFRNYSKNGKRPPGRSRDPRLKTTVLRKLLALFLQQKGFLANLKLQVVKTILWNF